MRRGPDRVSAFNPFDVEEFTVTVATRRGGTEGRRVVETLLADLERRFASRGLRQRRD